MLISLATIYVFIFINQLLGQSRLNYYSLIMKKANLTRIWKVYVWLASVLKVHALAGIQATEKLKGSTLNSLRKRSFMTLNIYTSIFEFFD